MDITTRIRLNNGVEIPMLGLGVFRSPAGRETEDAVIWALESGYRLIDTAAVYGNEQSVGEGIKKSGIPRKDVFITTKLWNDDMRQGRVREAFEKSLNKLGTDYIDLYLIHWPVAGKFIGSYKIMEEELCTGGRIRAIGVSNFNQHHIEELMRAADIVPAVNQVECHPHLNQAPLRALCGKMGIAFEAWAPIGRGKILNDPVLTELAKKYGKTQAQIVLRFELQKGIIVIPKSVHRDRIISNSQLYDFELDAADCAAIDGLNKDKRFGEDPENFTF